MKPILCAGIIIFGITGACSTVRAAEEPVSRIQFETNFIDLGKITGVDSIKGAFKFKNTGNGVLKITEVQASCDCTEAHASTESVKPGGSGEIDFTIKTDRVLNGQRMIHVRSNDPQSPDLQLTVQLDYTPLYRATPAMVYVNLPAGNDETRGSFLLRRGDGLPLGIERLTTSQPWVTAEFEAATFKPESPSARINVVVHRPPGPPGPINAKVLMWATNITHPVHNMLIAGEAQGELIASPAKLYWVIPDLGTNKSAYPAEALMKKVEIKSILGHDVKIKGVTNSVQGMKVEVSPNETARQFDVVLKFDEIPEGLRNGKVTLETSLASLPQLEIPITVAAPVNN